MTQEFQVADSGVREEQGTGMVRDSRAGKGRFDLIDPIAERRLAKWYEKGAAKYSDRNWEQGTKFSRYLDSAARHLNAYHMIALFDRQGISYDKLPAEVDPNEDHLAAAVWNIMCVMNHETAHPDLDDLHPRPAAIAPVEASEPESNLLVEFLRSLRDRLTEKES